MVALAPGAVVDVVVVVACGGHADLEEVVVGHLEERRRRHESPSGVPVHADPIDVDEAVPRGELLDGGLLVGQAVVTQIPVAIGPIGAVALGCPAAVPDLDHDEPELGQLLAAASRGERVRYTFHLRTGIDAEDDRVPLLGVKIEGLPHVAVEVRDAIRGLHGERLRHAPAGFVEAREVAFPKLHDLVALRVAQRRGGRSIDAGCVINEESLGRRQGAAMVRVAGVEQGQAGAVQVHAIQVLVVHVLAGFTAISADPHHALLLVERDDAGGAERPLRDRILQLSVGVVQVVVAPAGSLRPPDEALFVLHPAHALGVEVAPGHRLDEQGRDLAGLRVDDAVFHVSPGATGAVDPQLSVVPPGGRGVTLVLPARLYLNELVRIAVEDVKFGLADLLLAGHRVLVVAHLGARLCDRINEAELLQPAAVSAGGVERAGVALPGHGGPRAAPRAATEPVLSFACGRQSCRGGVVKHEPRTAAAAHLLGVQLLTAGDASEEPGDLGVRHVLGAERALGFCLDPVVTVGVRLHRGPILGSRLRRSIGLLVHRSHGGGGLALDDEQVVLAREDLDLPVRGGRSPAATAPAGRATATTGAGPGLSPAPATSATGAATSGGAARLAAALDRVLVHVVSQAVSTCCEVERLLVVGDLEARQ